jgi:ATP/ADP translocase
MNFNSKEKLFILFAMLCVFAISLEYAITRPTSNALFLTTFSAKGYPWVWLATVPINLLVVYFYNQLIPKIGPLRIFCFFALATMGINALSGFFYSHAPALIFLQYVWKDIYILLMFKQLWSMIHSTIASTRAKYLYGVIYGMGTVGALIGSLIPTFLAISFGSERILYLTIPAYSLLIFSYKMGFSRSALKDAPFEKELAEPKERALSLIRKTPLLIGVLLLVIFMQGSTALTEYRFNAHLELNILEKDLRTAYCGHLSFLISLLSMGLQFFGSILMIKLLGVRGCHFFVPLALGLSTLISILYPSFFVLSLSYVFLKAIDFSLFGVIREMLYVPLKIDAKFRAKAIIDVFAYRTSKALVSFLLLSLQLIAGAYLLKAASWACVGLFIAWFYTVFVLFRREGALTSS